MTIHLLNEERKNFCGRSRTVGGSVTVDKLGQVTCKECMKKKVETKKSVHSREHLISPSTHVSQPSSYDPALDLLNPLNPLSPLSPFSPLHHSDPSPHHDSPSHHDPSPSHDSGGYDSSGGSYDSGGGSDSGGGGGGD